MNIEKKHKRKKEGGCEWLGDEMHDARKKKYAKPLVIMTLCLSFKTTTTTTKTSTTAHKAEKARLF